MKPKLSQHFQPPKSEVAEDIFGISFVTLCLNSVVLTAIVDSPRELHAIFPC